MKYKVVFSAERRKSKKSGNIITRSVPIRMRVSFNGQRVEMTTGMRIDEDVWNDILMLSDKQKRRNVSVSQKRRIDAALSGVGSRSYTLIDLADLTGIQLISSQAMPQSYNIFRIDGTPVGTNMKSLDALSEGLYIINGKKVAIK